MNERLTPEQEQAIRERLQQTGRAHDLLVDATSDIRALLAEIDALRQEQLSRDLRTLIEQGKVIVQIDQTQALSQELLDLTRQLVKERDEERTRSVIVERRNAELRNYLADMQADTARAVELLEPLTRMRDVPPGTLRVQIEHALRYLRPLEDESKAST